MRVTEEMYLALFRGITDAQDMLPAKLENAPVMERLTRALREAESIYADMDDDD